MAVVGRWDQSRLDQVITNLVSNAIKYGDCKPIDVSVDGDDGPARWSSSAITASASRPHDHERIFGRFERAASSRNYGGIGLGLWIVKQIIDALGGTVSVESTPGDGSTFRVELPFQADKVRHPTPTGAGATHGADRVRVTPAQPS